MSSLYLNENINMNFNIFMKTKQNKKQKKQTIKQTTTQENALNYNVKKMGLFTYGLTILPRIIV